MTAYRLLAIDIDGTLVGHDLRIAPAVGRAVRAVVDLGVIVALATGRRFVAARPFAEALGLTTPIICYQGAMIRPIDGSPALALHTVPLDLAREAIAFGETRDIPMTMYLGDDCYTNRLRDIGVYTAMGHGAVIESPDLRAALAEPPIKFLYVSDDRGAGPIYDDLVATFDPRLEVTRSHFRFAELTAPNVSKGQALRWLATRWGIAPAETVAIGDQLNDRTMLEFAGVAVAMASGDPTLCAMADLVAPPPEQDGVAWAIRELFGVGDPLPTRGASA